MESLAAQPPAQERFRSFDPLASVHLLRFDLQTNQGQIRPETLERVQDEELSYLMEGMNRAARSEFVLQREGNDFAYFDRGEWKPYGGMLLTGIKAAKNDAQQDYRKQFLVERAVKDVENYQHMRTLRPGETHAWYSPYPYEVAAQYGDTFVQNCGFAPKRQMGFLYLATCEENGNVVLQSQTVDHSNETAFQRAMQAHESGERTGMDDMVQAYDEQLAAEQPGETFYAGRTDEEVGSNAYDFIEKQRDLIEYFIEGLVELAHTFTYEHEFEHMVKRHTYGVWAAFKERLDGQFGKEEQPSHIPAQHQYNHHALNVEVQFAFNKLANEGRVLVGCGGAISMLKGEEDILNADPSDVFKSIFGKGEDKFGSLEFKCGKGHSNWRPYGKLIDNCRKCGISVRC